MKVLKPLLWFLVPTAVIWATYFLIALIIGNGSDTVRILSIENFIRLFFQDEVFPKALFNTLIVALSPPLIASIVTYFITIIFKAKPLVMYGAIFAISVLVYFFSKYIFFVLNFILFDIFGALQCGIICCFICFIIDIISEKFFKKKSAE